MRSILAVPLDRHVRRAISIITDACHGFGVLSLFRCCEILVVSSVIDDPISLELSSAFSISSSMFLYWFFVFMENTLVFSIGVSFLLSIRLILADALIL